MHNTFDNCSLPESLLLSWPSVAAAREAMTQCFVIIFAINIIKRAAEERKKEVCVQKVASLASRHWRAFSRKREKIARDGKLFRTPLIPLEGERERE